MASGNRHEIAKGQASSCLGLDNNWAHLQEVVRSLAASPTVPVRHGGPTIEELVREELRPLLKVWLDRHLEPLLERLVKAEIERVVGRTQR